MELFSLILWRLIPLYLLVAAGYVAGRKFKVSRDTLAALLIYFITPAVMFNGVLSLDLRIQNLTLPVLFYVLCCGMCLLVLSLGRRIWKAGHLRPTRNLAAFAAGNGNTGYFGLPVSLAILGEEVMGLVLLSALGFVLFENTLGFFVTARGRHTAGESLRKVFRLPILYAFLAGVCANAYGLEISGVWDDLFRSIRGAYSVLGMMLIGIGVAGLSRFETDWKFIGTTFLAKFVLWPLLALSLIALDRHVLGFFGERIQQVMLVVASVPLAANTVAIASLLKVEPEKAAVAVLLSTIFALFFIPLMAAVFLA